MQSHHHIVRSESLSRPVLSPGYGALHRGIGLRRRQPMNIATLSAFALLAVAGLSLVGALTGVAP